MFAHYVSTEKKVRKFNKDSLKGYMRHCLKEIRELTGWNSGIKINVYPLEKEFSNYAVSIKVLTDQGSVEISKHGKNLLTVFNKAKGHVVRKLRNTIQKTKSQNGLQFKQLRYR